MRDRAAAGRADLRAAARPLRPRAGADRDRRLWVFTMFEFLLTLFRLDERASAFFAFTVANVLVTIPVTVWLVVVEDEGARGLLLGQYAPAPPSSPGCWSPAPPPAAGPRLAAAAADDPLRPADDARRALALLAQLHRPRSCSSASRPRRGRALRALRSSSPRRSTCWSAGFQLAWPPLAYSIRDDDEARRAYAVIVTWFVAGLRLRRRRAVAALALDRAAAGGARVLRVLRGDRPGLDRGDALRALPGAGRRPRPHRPHRVQLPGDRSRHRSPTSASTCSWSRPGDRRRRRRAGRLLRRRAGADVRLHPAPLPGALRVAAARPGRVRWSRGAGRRPGSCCCRPRGSAGWSRAPRSGRLSGWRSGRPASSPRRSAGSASVPRDPRAAPPLRARAGPARERPSRQVGPGSPARPYEAGPRDEDARP